MRGKSCEGCLDSFFLYKYWYQLILNVPKTFPVSSNFLYFFPSFMDSFNMNIHALHSEANNTPPLSTQPENLSPSIQCTPISNSLQSLFSQSTYTENMMHHVVLPASTESISNGLPPLPSQFPSSMLLNRVAVHAGLFPMSTQDSLNPVLTLPISALKISKEAVGPSIYLSIISLVDDISYRSPLSKINPNRNTMKSGSTMKSASGSYFNGRQLIDSSNPCNKNSLTSFSGCKMLAFLQVYRMIEII